MVATVRGEVSAGELGTTLMHEHVFVVSPENLASYGTGAWWDEEERVADARAKLRALAAAGIDTIVDPTVWGLGRDIPLIERVAAGIDLNIIVATGVYSYHDLPFPYANRGPGTLLGGDEPMVADFTRDLTAGIADTGVRAAFLKFAIEYPDVSDGVARIARAVAATHVATGAPITVHTAARGQTGRHAVRILRAAGVDLTMVVIGHAGDSTDLDYLMELADTGAILGMDRFGLDVYQPTATRVATIAALAARGYSDRMVLSHDASCFIDWFGPDSPEVVAAVTPNWHYRHIPDDVLPALRAAGVTDPQLDQMLVQVPRRYFGGGR